jgi:hypothetical protein
LWLLSCVVGLYGFIAALAYQGAGAHGPGVKDGCAVGYLNLYCPTSYTLRTVQLGDYAECSSRFAACPVAIRQSHASTPAHPCVPFGSSSYLVCRYQYECTETHNGEARQLRLALSVEPGQDTGHGVVRPTCEFFLQWQAEMHPEKDELTQTRSAILGRRLSSIL